MTAAWDNPRMSELPEHLRALIAEIETEIGESAPNGGGDGLLPHEREELATGSGPQTEAPPEVGASATTGDRPVEGAVRQILQEIGEDPDRPGLAGTPERVHRMYVELTAGYHVDPRRLINGAIFDVAYSEMVVVKEIPFHSLCEHHLLPFFGTAAVGYLPRGRVIGLSKIPRIVEMYARRLQLQERMTQQVADFLQEQLDPLGVGVIIEATHLCTVMRGVRKSGTVMTTSALLGSFRSRDKTRAEFLAHVERRSNPL